MLKYAHDPITYVVGVLRKYLSDPNLAHWKCVKKVLRYLQGTKDLVLTYWRYDILDGVKYYVVDFTSYSYDRRSTSNYVFMMVG